MMFAPFVALILAFLPAGEKHQVLGARIGSPTTGVEGIRDPVRSIMSRTVVPQGAPFGQIYPRKQEHSVRISKTLEPSSRAVSRQPDRIFTARRKLNPQPIGTSFLGASLSLSGFVPPDSMGAVGPSQIMVATNGRIRVFSRTGVLGDLDTTIENFFSSVGGGPGVSDPRCHFDRLSQRWFVSCITLTTPNRVLIGVSDASTITDQSSFDFYYFQFDTSGGGGNGDLNKFFDQPSLGVDINALYIGGNVFSAGAFSTTAFVVRKSSVLNGGPIVVTAFRNLGSNAVNGIFSPLGVENDNPAATVGYFVGVSTLQFGQIVFRRISNPGATPSISANLFVTVPSTQYPQMVPCLGSTIPLDATDDRLFQAMIHRNRVDGTESLWTSHSFEVNSSGVASASGNRNGARWYEFRNLAASPSLTQSGTLFDSATSNPNNFWFPSIAMTGQGHVALAASVAGGARRAEIATAGRLRTDPLGTLQAVTTVQTSSTNYNVESGVDFQRWGDYSRMAVDPNDDMTLWSFQEYCNAANSWGVRVFALQAPPPAAPSSVVPNAQPQGAVNVNLALTGSSSLGSGWFDPYSTYPNRIAASFSGTGVTINSVSFLDPTHLTLNVSIASDAPVGQRNLTITNPDGQSRTTNNIFQVTPPDNPAPTITSLNPTSVTSLGSAFVLAVNGSGFVAASAVQWNGVSRPTTFISANELEASIPATDILTHATIPITVFNPPPGGGTSNLMNFQVKRRIVRGTVTLRDFTGDVTAVPIEIQIRDVGNTSPIYSTSVNPDSNGEYEFQLDLAPGSYDFAAKGPHWLRKRTANVAANEEIVAGVDFQMVNGDCDGDNEITLVDVGIVSSAFGSAAGDPQYLENADVDGDGEVNLLDYGIVASAFGMAGDE